jgi:ABC-type uncharacterized transport system permease subunit
VTWFEVGSAVFYLAASGLFVGSFPRWSNRVRRMFLSCLWIGFSLSTLGLLFRAVDALAEGILPFAGSSRLLDLLAWSFAAVALFNRKNPKLFPVISALVPLAFLSALMSIVGPDVAVPRRAYLPEALFALHVGVLALATVCFCFSFLSSLAYLAGQRELKSRRLGRWFGFLPPLETLDRGAVRSLAAGVLLLTVGNVTGIYLAHVFWKVNWLAQTKFLLSIGTWVWFLSLLAFRHWAGWRGARFLLFVVAGFVLLLGTMALSFVWKAPWT